MTSNSASTVWRASHPDFPDDIRFALEALSHLQAHRQTGWFAKEAGGQLFGLAVDTGLLVVAASGPYPRDARTRTSYRSNPDAAAREIKKMRERGLFYLDEWHTHPELHPHPSGSDVDAFMRLVQNSRFATAVPVLVIQGQACSPKGLAVLTCENRRLFPWQVADSSSTPALPA